MKIIVFIKSVPDTKISVERLEDTHRLKRDWNISTINPDDEAAVAAVVKVKQEIPGTHITVVHLGPPSGERFIRDAIALGCDDGLRIWEESLNDIGCSGKALIFSRVARILGFDLLVTGTRSLDSGNGQLGVLLAHLLEVPCVTRVTGIDRMEPDSIVVTRNLDQGFRERVESVKPLVIAMEAEAERSMTASFTARVQASEREIPCIDLSRIGISCEALQQADSHLVHGRLRFPVPKMQFARPPDSSLPAFERRLQLAGLSAERREGNLIECYEDSAAEEIFQILLRKGWLSHLRKNNPKV